MLCCLALTLALHFDIPSSAFMLAAMATSLFAGRRAGALAIVLSIGLFDFFFLMPQHQFFVGRDSLVRFTSFVVAVILSTEMIHAKRRSDVIRLEREKDFRSLAETSPDSVLIIDEHQSILFANTAVTRMLGYTESELIGQPASVVLAGVGTKIVAGELQAQTKAGSQIDVEATIGSFSNKRTIFLRDITERKEAQRILQRSEETLRTTLDTIPGMVYIRTGAGQIEYINRHALDYFGGDPVVLSEGGWADALHPDEKEAVLSRIRENFATKRPYVMEYRRRRFDGTYRWFQTAVQPLLNEKGEVVRWYGLITDVDDRKRFEDSLRQTESRLSQAAQMATAAELSASIVHEISQPIAAMVANGQASLRWMTADPPNLPSSIASTERIVRDGKDAREIIRGLRALFKHAAPQISPLNVDEIIDEVLILTKHRVVRHGVAVERNGDANLPLVKADRIQLQQVLLNLVSNAIDAMKAADNDSPRRLMIGTFKRDGEVEIQIADSGVGVKDADKIFDLFFTTKSEGMGVGLSICRSIIQTHGGRLWVENREPRGATFYVAIPAGEPSPLR